MKKTIAVFALGIMFASIFLTANASAVKIGRWDYQLRPANTVFHPGLTEPYYPPEDGANHAGVSDYKPRWNWVSELCEIDMQLRPFNQGLNIPRFFSCSGPDV